MWMMIVLLLLFLLLVFEILLIQTLICKKVFIVFYQIWWLNFIMISKGREWQREKEGKKNTKKIKKELKIQAIKNKGFVVNH